MLQVKKMLSNSSLNYLVHPDDKEDFLNVHILKQKGCSTEKNCPAYVAQTSCLQTIKQHDEI